MPWSQEFIDWIAGDIVEPRYILRSVEIGSFNSTSSPLKLSSFTAPGYSNVLTHEGSSITHGALTPGTWDRTFGGLTLGLAEDIRHLVARGQAVELLVGAPGWEVHRFQTVWLGTVRNVYFRGGRWSLEAVELPGALQNRFSDDTDTQNLFYQLPAKTKLDGGGFDPAVDGFTVLDGSGFNRNNQGNYCARVTPSDGNVYYVTATGKSGLSFSGTAPSGATPNVFDSPLDSHHPPGVGTAEPAEDDDTVEAIAWIRAHPIYFGLRVLTSSGTATPGSAGTNGPDDLFPAASWGYHIPHGLVDRSDALAFKDLTTPISPAPEHWDFLIDHSQSDGVSFLAEELRPGGFFLSQHQGCLTVRAMVRPSAVATPGSISIYDSDLSDLSYETWDSESPVEYKKIRVLGYNEADPYSFTEDHLATRPTRQARRRDLVAAFSDVSDGWTFEVGERLGLYDTRVPERIIVTTVGWRCAVASIGDQARLHTAYVTKRSNESDDVFNGDATVIVAGGPDWFGSTCRFELLYLPNAAGLE